jgi:hypothetical protein
MGEAGLLVDRFVGPERGNSSRTGGLEGNITKEQEAKQHKLKRSL